MKKIVFKKKLYAFTTTLFVFGIASFFILQKPVAPELTFKEHSLSAGKIGNVLPASCTSTVSHFTNDCTRICSGSSNILVRTNTYYDPGTNSCVCNNGKTNPPVCNEPAVILTADNLLQPSINSFTVDNNNLNYGNGTYLRWGVTNAATCNGSWGQTGLPFTSSYYTGILRVDKNYTLTCYNGPKQISATVGIAVETYADAGCGTNPCP